MNVQYGAATLDLRLTSRLCEFLSTLSFEQLPDPVVHEAKRGILDWLGCALAGSPHPTIDKLTTVLSSVSGEARCTVFGRDLQLGLLEAPIANGQMGHLLDYDDTHMGGVVLHTSSPVLGALFALADARPTDGKTFMTSYVAGFEVGVRAGRAAPAHHDGGWHLTGTLGTIAAGAAAARQINLAPEQYTYATGVAATQASGMQQNRGTMCKSFHAGRAASNGVLAALLAEQGYDSSSEILEGKRGFCRIFSATDDVDALIRDLGDEWIISTNGYKPYACGVVLHPLIDAMIALRQTHDLTTNDIERIDATVHETMIRITGVQNPETGLKSKFSYAHAGAVAFLDGTAGIGQYTDERANDPEVDALRRKIFAHADDGLRKDQARIDVKTKDDRELTIQIDHATGTVDNPMSDAAIETKFRANAATVLDTNTIDQVVDTIWSLDTVDDVRTITRLCAGT